jgi:uncharacterized protein (DUF1800 family)
VVNRLQLLLVLLLAVAISGCAVALPQGGSGGNPPPGPQPFTVTVSPSPVSVREGGLQQFTATVAGNSNTNVAWSVNGIPGGNATLGTVTGNGSYQAPANLPNPNNITVTATSLADATVSGSSAVTLQNPMPVLTAVNPNSISVGSFQIGAFGTGFVSGAVVIFGGQALITTFVSSTQLTATGTATTGQAGDVTVTVKNPDPGSATSNGLIAHVTIPNSGISVTVTPGTATLRAGDPQTFVATVNGTTDQTVSWAVNGTPGGYDTVGTIDTNGNYFSPDNLTNPNTITITAISAADSTKSGKATVTLLNPIPVLNSAAPGLLSTGIFQITLNGTGFVNTSTVTFGGQPLSVTYLSPTMLTAIGTATPAQVGTVSIIVSNPNPGAGTSGAASVQVTANTSPVSSTAAVRFLEQSSFGPDTESLYQLQQLGFDTYLQNQFGAPISAYTDPRTANSSANNLQAPWFLVAIGAGDQLRQRVALALNELWVVAGDKVSDQLGYTNYLRTLEKDALGNYFDVMKDITLTPAMGNYLDMVNNDKPSPGQHANENYAREIMQLFCLGLNKLNPDGTSVLDGTGTPVPAYTQDDVMALGLAFTGWTYPTQPGKSLQKHNPSYYGGPMVAVDSNHDTEAKTLLGTTIPAGQNSASDLDASLNIIFNHPNVGPFVARQLILRLVSSNPTPAYVQRVAQAFNSGSYGSYGTGKRGDLQATVAAVLLDPEARQGDSSITAVATDGKLREPIVMEVSIARAFHAQTDAGGFAQEGDQMSQNVLFPATVFNFFPPVSPIPSTTLNGPEFAIFDTNTSLARDNFINDAVYGAIGGHTKLDFSPVTNAGTPDQMLAWLDTMFLHGTMPDQMKQIILPAVNTLAASDTKGQAKAAIYLVTSSSMYQVQH